MRVQSSKLTPTRPKKKLRRATTLYTEPVSPICKSVDAVSIDVPFNDSSDTLSIDEMLMLDTAERVL